MRGLTRVESFHGAEAALRPGIPYSRTVCIAGARALVRAVVFALGLASVAGCTDKNKGAASDAGVAAADASSAPVAVAEGGAPPVIDAGTAADEAMPPTAGDELSARMRHLLEAITQNNPDLAGDVMFPRDAYLAAKDAPDPAKVWEKKVSQSFRRSVERTHQRTKGVAQAKFVSFELGKTMNQITPKKKDFKKPLWRVKHSKLTFAIDGKTHHLVIAEMTAWRGAWYVTRLR